MTLTKKLCKKSGLFFIIPFHKLPQKCLKVPQKITIFMHNMQTQKCLPYILKYGLSVVNSGPGCSQSFHD